MAIPLELSQFAKVIEYNSTGTGGSKVGVGINTNHTSFAIGIGTTNPSATLDVDGTLNVTGLSTFTSTVEIKPDSAVNALIIDGTNASPLDSYPLVTLRGAGPNGIDFRDSGNGNGLKLVYRTSPDQFAVENSENTTTHFKIDRDDGRVELNYGGFKKFETTGVGVTVTGITSTTVLHASAGTYDAGQDTKTDSAIVIRTEGKIYTQHGSGPSAGYLRNLISNNNGAITIGQTATSLINAVDLYPGSSGSINLYHGGGDKKFETTGYGVSITGGLNVSGVSTIGLANTSLPLNNSQMSFELTSDTNLRIKVRGSDGVLRSADITLS